MVLLNKCCFCVNLRSGGMTISVLAMITNVLAFIGCIWGFVWLSQQDPKKENVEGIVVLKAILGIAVVLVILSSATFVLMIMGIKKNREGYLKPYLIVNGIGCALMVLGLFNQISALSNGSVTVVNFLLNIFGTVFSCYLWACVLSLYQLIKEENNQGRFPIA